MKKIISVFPFFFVFPSFLINPINPRFTLHASHFTPHVLSLSLEGAGGELLLSLHVELVGSEADNGETVSNKNDGSILEVGIDILQKTVLRLNVER